MSQRQNEEIELVRRLLEVLSISAFTLEAHDKPDVLATINGHRIGIEVTVFHGDEGQNLGGGSHQRRAEEQINRNASGRPYAMWGTVNSLVALVARIKDKIKCAESYSSEVLDELWLLIAASVPQLGAVCSTFILPIALNLDDLNNKTDGILRGSPFKKAYLHVIMGQCLYEWSSSEEWQMLRAPEEDHQGFDTLMALKQL
ncbi:MAG: hypothetical protein ACRESX_03850 [Gammaproteobacteria bacterium]